MCAEPSAAVGCPSRPGSRACAPCCGASGGPCRPGCHASRDRVASSNRANDGGDGGTSNNSGGALNDKRCACCYQPSRSGADHDPDHPLLLHTLRCVLILIRGHLHRHLLHCAICVERALSCGARGSSGTLCGASNAHAGNPCCCRSGDGACISARRRGRWPQRRHRVAESRPDVVEPGGRGARRQPPPGCGHGAGEQHWARAGQRPCCCGRLVGSRQGRRVGRGPALPAAAHGCAGRRGALLGERSRPRRAAPRRLPHQRGRGWRRQFGGFGGGRCPGGKGLGGGARQAGGGGARGGAPRDRVARGSTAGSRNAATMRAAEVPAFLRA
mmetsp:Transcript_53134/g.137258  ORF Transcript_53134/g.137258 Transcript_53134/m.137258 type:complete len:329 (+) Transcript_53134:1216-2202(+)